MKKLSVTLTLLLIVFCSIGQLQNANWCFGFNAGVNFNTTPASTFTSEITNTNIGMRDVGASVSDNNGNLRFYTDGVNVWDNTHTLMPNGTGLFGYFDAGTFGQSVVIVPKPGNANLYYIFTMSTLYLSFQGGSNPVGRGGLHYSIVDMSLNNGKGDVMPNLKNIIISNHNGTLLDYPLDYAVVNTNPVFINQRSRMTTSLHANGDKIWLSVILDYYYNNQNTRWFYNYPISQNGISNMLDGTSPTPTVFQQLSAANYNTTIWGIGGMKVSPDGQFICDVEDVVNLYDYNNQTGSVSFNRQVYNSQTILPGYHSTGYGVEFSPNSEIIYFTDNPDGIIQGNGKSTTKPNPSKNYVSLYQYNIHQQTTTIIHNYPPPIAPAYATTPIPVQAPYGLQLSIDNKIYLCASGNLQQYRNYLGVINSPNTLGLGCNFSPTGLQLSPNTFNNGTMPQWVHKATLTIWPKVYEALESNGIKIDNSGNIFSAMYFQSMANNINHNGVTVTTNGDHYLHYNVITGATNWVTQFAGFPVALNSGDVQFIYSLPAIYRNGTTGVITSGPSYVPTSQRILAEDNTTFITIAGNSLYVQPALGGGSTIALPSFSGYSSYGFIDRAIYNPATKNLFISLSHYHSGSYVQLLYIYKLNANNTLSLLNNPLFNEINGRLAQINSVEDIFVYNYNGTIQKYIYQSNTYTSLSINNFNNTSLEYITPSNQLVEDRILITNTSDNFIYCINTVALTSKKIPFTATLGSINFYNYYHFYNNDVFISGEYRVTGITIGNQTMPLLGTASAYITRFNIQTDFTFRKIEGEGAKTLGNQPDTMVIPRFQKNEIEIAIGIKAVLSPNPVKQNLQINLEQIKDNPAISYQISITNAVGISMFSKNATQKILNVNVSQFKAGLYYLTITTVDGKKITQRFIKE